jgi:hypothetical protein
LLALYYQEFIVEDIHRHSSHLMIDEIGRGL